MLFNSTVFCLILLETPLISLKIYYNVLKCLVCLCIFVISELLSWRNLSSNAHVDTVYDKSYIECSKVSQT